MKKKLFASFRLTIATLFMVLSANLPVLLPAAHASGNPNAVTCPTGSFEQGNNCKVTICHRTSAVDNPYVKESVDLDSVDGNNANDNGQGDHYLDHTGPVFNSSMQQGDSWGDIIPAIDGVHSGLNWTTDGQAIYNNDCAPVESPTDVCANIDGVQTEVPDGMVQDGDDCVTPPTDVCANIDGVQTEVPEGLVQDGEDCVTDVCPNLEGVQADVPEGLVQDENGDCVTDVCPNIEGIQTDVPDGMVVNNDGNCETPEVNCPSGSFQQGNNCKVTICHRTSAVANPYTQISVDISAVDGDSSNDNGQGDHLKEHTGPVFNSSMQQGDSWGDIIPPVDGVEDGLNWTTDGQAIYNNDCNVPQNCVPTEDTPLLDNLQFLNNNENNNNDENCPTDVCPNIEGVQTDVPDGMVTDDNGDCVTPPPTDVCPNIEGVQENIPAGMNKDNNGNCVTPQVGEVLGISTTKKQPELVNTGENPLASVVAGATLLVLAVGSTLLTRRQTSKS